MTNDEDRDHLRLRAFEEARSEEPHVDRAAALAWVQAAFAREHEKAQAERGKRSANERTLKGLYKQTLGKSGRGKGGGLLLDSGHTWAGRTALDVPPILTAFTQIANGVIAGGHQFVSIIANPLLAGAGRSLTNVLVGMQIDTPQFAHNMKSADNLSGIIADMRSSREQLQKINEALRKTKEALIYENKDQDSKQRVQALREHLSPDAKNPQESPLLGAILKADRDQRKYPEHMALSKLNWQSRRHIMLVAILDGVASAASFAKGGVLGSIITKLALNPLYVIAGHYDFKTKIHKTDEYNAKYADMVKEGSKHKPVVDLTEDDINVLRIPHDRSKADTRASYIEIMACEDLGNSFLKLSKLESKLRSETREGRRQQLQSDIDALKEEREAYKKDLDILRKKRNYEKLSPGKIRKCILNDTFYIMSATLALLRSPGVLAGDYFQRLTTTEGTLIPGFGHELGTTHDIPAVAHGLGPDASAAMVAGEEAFTSISTGPGRHHKATAFNLMSVPVRKADLKTPQPQASLASVPLRYASPMRPPAYAPRVPEGSILPGSGGALPMEQLDKKPETHDSFASLHPWPEEVSAKSSAAYKSCYTLRQRTMHNIKGLGRFAIAVPLFLHHRRQARNERKLLKQTMAETNSLVEWFAVGDSSATAQPLSNVEQMKIFLKELHTGLHPKQAARESQVFPSGFTEPVEQTYAGARPAIIRSSQQGR